jgi:hypothetical protein
MFMKRNLVAIFTVTLMLFAGQQAIGYSDTEVIDYTWYEDDYPAADNDLLGGAYKATANIWNGLSDMFNSTVNDVSGVFEDSPRMESPAPKPLRDPQPQVHYEYIPRHTTGYPKWVRRPAK